MKFAIWILVLTGFFSLFALLASELIPEGLLHTQWAQLLNIHDPFRSWWFRFLLGLLTLSLSVCIIDRAPILIRQALRRTFNFQEKSFTDNPGTIRFSSEDGVKAVSSIMSSLKFNFKQEVQDNKIAITGATGRSSRLGPLLTHIGMLLLIMGGLISGFTGVNKYVTGSSGDIINEEDWDFSLRIDDFNIKYYPLSAGQFVETSEAFRGKISRIVGDSAEVMFSGHKDEKILKWYPTSTLKNDFLIFDGQRSQPYQGNVKGYITNATVLVDTQEILRKQIEVNSPLRFRGFRFYQSSFNLNDIKTEVDTIDLSITPPNQKEIVLTVPNMVGQTFEIDGYELSIENFLQDFRLDSEMKPFSASGQLRNPAVLLNITDDSGKSDKQWIFTKARGMMGHDKTGLSIHIAELKGMRSSTVDYSTVLSVNHNKGGLLIWLGFIFGTIGLFLAYSSTCRIVRALVNKQPGKKDQVFLMLKNYRSDEEFKNRYQKIFDGFKNT